MGRAFSALLLAHRQDRRWSMGGTGRAASVCGRPLWTA